MSKTTKRKYVAQEVLDAYIVPQNEELVVKVLSSCGNNLHQVETCKGEKFLASMPTKFRKNLWIKRGDFVIAEPIKEGGKVKAEIVHILYKQNIEHIKQEGKWPEEFKEEARPGDLIQGCREVPGDSDDSDSDSDKDLFVNTNRPQIAVTGHSSDSSDESEDSDATSDEGDQVEAEKRDANECGEEK